MKRALARMAAGAALAALSAVAWGGRAQAEEGPPVAITHAHHRASTALRLKVAGL